MQSVTLPKPHLISAHTPPANAIAMVANTVSMGGTLDQSTH